MNREARYGVSKLIKLRQGEDDGDEEVVIEEFKEVLGRLRKGKLK